MRVVVNITSNPEGWAVTLAQLPPIAGDPFAHVVRQLRRVTAIIRDTDVTFPLPPKAEADALLDPMDRELCDGVDLTKLAALHDAFVDRRPDDRGVARLGRYLLLTLLGHDLWAEVRGAAAGGELELRLAADSDDKAILRLPWEAMWGSLGEKRSGFLAAEKGLAITRTVIKGTRAFTPISGPPGVLFVVGCDLNDSAIRPAAEYIGLIRSLKSTSSGLRTCLLSSATLTDIEEKLRSFRPQILHFIGHGEAGNGEPYLLLSADKSNAAPGETSGKRIFLHTLRQITQAAGVELELIVLNACSSAQVTSGAGPALVPSAVLAPDSCALPMHRAMPLAMGLVAEGVAPAVVGMAGRISDLACRLFTRRLYEALINGSDVTQACAEGRRAGIIGSTDSLPESSVDWALPTLFLANAIVEPRLLITRDKNDLEWGRLSDEYAPPPRYPFCGRLTLLNEFDQMMISNRAPNQGNPGTSTDTHALVVRSLAPKRAGDRYGKTSLLIELARKALSDGHLPILFSPGKHGLSGNEFRKRDPGLWIEKRDDLAAMFRAALIWPVRRFDLPIKPAVQLKLVQEPSLAPDAHADVRAAWELDEEGPDKACHQGARAAALRVDLLTLLDAVNAKFPDNPANPRRLVLLFDDVHGIGADACKLLLNSYLGPDGVRKARNRIRVVVAFDELVRPEHRDLQQSVQEFQSVNGARSIDLNRFDDRLEVRLAYQQYLLHWRPDNDFSKPDPTPLAFHARLTEKLFREFFEDAFGQFRHAPSQFERQDEFGYFIETRRKARGGIDYPALIDAKDDDFLRIAQKQ